MPTTTAQEIAQLQKRLAFLNEQAEDIIRQKLAEARKKRGRGQISTNNRHSRISTWAENNPSLSGTASYNLGYDGSDELTTAQLSGTGAILKVYAYTYRRGRGQI